MKLQGKVRRVAGITREYISTLTDDGRLVRLERISPPTFIEIEGDGYGYLMLHYDENGQGLADDWFASIDEAKHHAKREFGIEEADWTELP